MNFKRVALGITGSSRVREERGRRRRKKEERGRREKEGEGGRRGSDEFQEGGVGDHGV
jgi:hypothetical protein